MSSFLISRRRLLAQRGRPMVLRRPGTPYIDVTVQGFKAAFSPEQITGGVQQGDCRVQILADEITAAAWPGPPKNKDSVVVDGRTWSVQGATPLYDGATLLGFSLWVRGG
jgi:hypothetical protein